jgi:hypothetical protein
VLNRCLAKVRRLLAQLVAGSTIDRVPTQPAYLDEHANRCRPFRSTTLVYQGDTLLPWIVADPTMVGKVLGSFHHGPGFIHFSTPDGSDPRDKGRSCEVIFRILVALLEPSRVA